MLLYYRTFGASYAYDDIDYLNEAAETLSGRPGFWSSLFRPHQGHIVPALRALFTLNTWLFGTNALAFRLLIFASHIGTAFLLALIARKLCPSRWAAPAAALAYVLPAGLSSMYLWFPTAGGPPLGLVCFSGALAAVVFRRELGPRLSRALAILGILLTLSFESALLPMIFPIAFVDEVERRREVKPRSPAGLISLFCLILGVLTVAIASGAYTQSTSLGVTFHPLAAVERAVFLVLVAPFRLVFPGLLLVRPAGASELFPFRACLFGLFLTLLGSAFAAAVLRKKALPLAVLSGITLTGPLGFILLVAIGRWDVRYQDLYDADRYFFPLLIPLSLLAGAVTGSIPEALKTWSTTRQRVVVILALAAVLVELRFHQRALIERVPFEVYQQHARRFQQLSELGRLLSEAADQLPEGAPPLRVPDASLFFEEVHNHRISTRLLLFLSTRPRSPRLQLGALHVDARDQSLLNPVLDRWASGIGEPTPYFSVIDGELRNAREQGTVRFGLGPADASVNNGFYGWENEYRWMAGEGDLNVVATSERLTLVLGTPLSSILKARPEWTSIPVTVTVINKTSGEVNAVGTIQVRQDGIHPYELKLPEGLASSLKNRPVRLILRAEHTWRPVDVIPGSRDDRTLSVQVYEAGFRP
ncbi:MAG: hypothetical protein ABIT01_16340 [Thermoanaerobaculia bacterium]